MKFRSRKENGKLVFQPGHKELIQAYLSRFKDGDVFVHEIRRPQKLGSNPYRRYYFGVVLKDFMAGLFYEPHEKDMFHEQLKELYFQVKPDEHGFKRIPNVFHKKKGLSVKKQIEYVDWVKRLAAQQDIYLPDPNE